MNRRQYVRLHQQHVNQWWIWFLLFTEIARALFLLSQTSRTFLSNFLFLDITWNAWRSLNSLSLIAWQQYKQEVLNSNVKPERSFLGEGCPSSEFDFVRFKFCSLVLKLTYLARQAICTPSPVDIVQLSPLRFFSNIYPINTLFS